MKQLFSKRLSWSVNAVVMCSFVYGMFNIPGVPVRPCGTQYCSKYGDITTKAAYETSLLFENAFVAYWFLILLHTLAGWFLRKKGKL